MRNYIKNMKTAAKVDYATYLGVILAFVVVSACQSAGLLSRSVTGMLVPICCYVCMAVSLNLTVGILGELSLGHAGFMSVGAFSGIITAMSLQSAIPNDLARMVLALVVGAFFAAIVGFIVGIPVLRLRGDYLAIVTLAFGEIIKNIINACYLGYDSTGLHFSLQDQSSMGLDPDGTVLINGAMGITRIQRVSNFTIGILLVLATVAVVLNLIRSRTGRAITAIRDNEIAAQSAGINLTRYKLTAFVVSAVFAGLAGVLYGLNFSSLTASRFDYNTSIQILVFVVLGGMGSVRGSIIAAALLTVLPEMLRGLNDYRMLIYAIVLIAMMIFNQSPQIAAWRKRLVEKVRTGLGKSKKTKEVA